MAEVQFRWKEEVVYWEGDRGFVFDGGWGVQPSVTYVPDEEAWDQVVPEWLVGRRDEVIRRLAMEPGHVIEVSGNYTQGEGWRQETRP